MLYVWWDWKGIFHYELLSLSQTILRGHSNLDPRKKSYFCEIINKNIDIEFVRLNILHITYIDILIYNNKHTVEIHYKIFFHLFYTLFIHKNVSQTQRLEK